VAVDRPVPVPVSALNVLMRLQEQTKTMQSTLALIKAPSCLAASVTNSLLP
jgi:hypothetical protein